MGPILEIIYDLFTKPASAMLSIKEHISVKQAFLVLAMCNILGNLTFTGDAELDNVRVYTLALSLVLMVPGWAITAGVLHGMAHLVGGHGGYQNMLKLLAFNSCASMLMIPLALISLLAPSAGGALLLLGSWVVLGLSSYWNVLAISINYGISKLRALFAYILPLLLFSLFLIIVVMLFFASLESLFNDISTTGEMLQNGVQL